MLLLLLPLVGDLDHLRNCVRIRHRLVCSSDCKYCYCFSMSAETRGLYVQSSIQPRAVVLPLCSHELGPGVPEREAGCAALLERVAMCACCTTLRHRLQRFLTAWTPWRQDVRE